MRIDVMVDIETLGTKTDSTIIQISSVAFNIETGEYISKFDRVADISKNESYDMRVTGSTLKWWLNTNKELLATLLNRGVGSSRRLLEDFHGWLVGLSTLGDLYLWGNGILFDNAMIRHQLEENGLDYPINYKRDRDVRTIVDLTCVKLKLTEKELRERYYDPTLEPHDAFNDVTNQINLVVNCYRELLLEF
jgi:hypothetical protein